MSRSTRQLAQRFLEVAPAALYALRPPRTPGEPGGILGQMRCLHALEAGPRSLGELAAGYGVSAPTMSRMISVMVDRGWVSRADAPEDRRQLVLSLLPSGREALRDLQAHALDRLAELLEALDPGEQAALATGLDGLARAVSAAKARGAACDRHE